MEKGGFFYEDAGRATARHLRHLAHRDRSPQQSERDQPHLPPGRARTHCAPRKKWPAAPSPCRATKEEMAVPHILKDGADSIGVPGATIRVYVNIGMFSEYWLTRHNRLIGLTDQKPFEISYAREHSVFWRATEERLGTHRGLFPPPATVPPRRRARRRGPSHDRRSDPRPRQTRLRQQLRPMPFEQTTAGRDRSGVGRWQSLVPDRRHAAGFSARTISSPTRSAIRFQKSRPTPPARMGTNAMAGHIWDNFSSQTYKELPPPGRGRSLQSV